MQSPRPLTAARLSTSAKLRGLELPDSFASATVATEARELARPVADRRPADLRRAASKARRVDALPARAILLGGFHGGGR
jgi:hypothetical protein